MLKSLVKKVTQSFQTRRRSTLTGKISPGEVYMDEEKLRMASSLWRIQKEEKEMRGNRLSTLESTVG